MSWHSASGNFDVALVDGGALSLTACAQEISSNIGSLTAVMIQDEHFQSICGAFGKGDIRQEKPVAKPKLDIAGCHHLTSTIYTLDWTLLANPVSVDEVESALRAAQKAGAVLFVKSKSLEQNLERPPTHSEYQANGSAKSEIKKIRALFQGLDAVLCGRRQVFAVLSARK